MKQINALWCKSIVANLKNAHTITNKLIMYEIKEKCDQ